MLIASTDYDGFSGMCKFVRGKLMSSRPVTRCSTILPKEAPTLWQPVGYRFPDSVGREACKTLSPVQLSKHGAADNQNRAKELNRCHGLMQKHSGEDKCGHRIYIAEQRDRLPGQFLQS